jgi:hypothetical protein
MTQNPRKLRGYHNVELPSQRGPYQHFDVFVIVEMVGKSPVDALACVRVHVEWRGFAFVVVIMLRLAFDNLTVSSR